MHLAKWAALAALPLLGAIALAARPIAEKKIDRALRGAISEACPACRVDWDKLSLGVRGVSFRNFTFETAPGEITVIAARIPYLDIGLRWKDVYHRRMIIRAIRAESPDVTIREIEGHNPRSNAPPPAFAVEGVEITDATFTYEIREFGRFGRVRLDKIYATISGFGGLPPIVNERTTAKAEARLEGSGEVNLLVDALVFGPEPDLTVKLTLLRQQLAGLNEYFRPIDGVELEGKILKGNASAEIRGERLSAWADVRYEGFDIKFLRTRDRGGLKAFLSNIVADLKLEETKRSPDGKAVLVQRKKVESIVSFILRGLREAALRVATVK